MKTNASALVALLLFSIITNSKRVGVTWSFLYLLCPAPYASQIRQPGWQENFVFVAKIIVTIVIVFLIHPHLIFVIFLHRQNFWRIKFTPKNANFSRYICKKTPIFRVTSEKIYTGQKKFTRAPPVAPVTNMRYGVNILSWRVSYVKSVRLCAECKLWPEQRTSKDPPCFHFRFNLQI